MQILHDGWRTLHTDIRLSDTSHSGIRNAEKSSGRLKLQADHCPDGAAGSKLRDWQMSTAGRCDRVERAEPE